MTEDPKIVIGDETERPDSRVFIMKRGGVSILTRTFLLKGTKVMPIGAIIRHRPDLLPDGFHLGADCPPVKIDGVDVKINGLTLKEIVWRTLDGGSEIESCDVTFTWDSEPDFKKA